MSARRIVRTSDDLPRGHWMKRQLPRGASLRGYAEDQAVSMLLREVHAAIEAAGMSRADVARVLGVTKSRVSQVLNGSPNVSLKTLGAFLWAAGRGVDRLVTDSLGHDRSAHYREDSA